jgi:F420H(2)-dependent quinone reductase
MSEFKDGRFTITGTDSAMGFAATARRASVEEKAQLWPRLVAMYPAYEGYQNRTTRDIPVVAATPDTWTIATCLR